MAYEKRDDVAVGPGEMAVELDTGELVALSCTRALAGDRFAFQVRARQLDGSAVREFVHTAPAGADADDVARQCLLAALGEPNTLMLSDAVAASYSIRVAIEHGQAVGPVDVRAVL